MKRLTLITLLGLMCTIYMSAQPATHYPGFDAYFQDPAKPGFSTVRLLPYSLNVEVRTKTDEVLYKEFQVDSLDAFGHAREQIGTGVRDPNVGTDFEHIDWSLANYVYYDFLIHEPGGDVQVDGEQDFDVSPFSTLSYCADKANALGDYKWDERELTPEYLAHPVNNGYFYIPSIEENSFYNKFGKIPLSNYIRPITGISTVNGATINYMHIGTTKPCPATFGPVTYPDVSSYYAITTGSMVNYFSGLTITIPDDSMPTLGHTTYAGSFNNLYDPAADGVFVAAANIGVYGTGLNGSYGETKTDQTGYGVWGRVTAAPANGQTKAGILGQSFSNNNYGMMNLGRCVTNSSWETMSDARLKTDIQYEHSTLDKVMQLHPATYEYINDTPIQFSDGKQHGFIAQDLEKVFPEMVTEVLIPENLEPHQAITSKEYKAIKYNDLIPVLTSAIQELKEQLDAQALVIAELKKELQQQSGHK